MAPEHVGFAQELVALQPRFGMVLEMRNSGRSTATIEKLEAVIDDKTLPPIPQYGKATDFVFPPIVPGGSSRRRLIFDIDKGWNEQKVADFTAGRVPFFFYGRITYRDGYSGMIAKGPTGFCFQYVPDGTTKGNTFDTCQLRAYTY